MKQSIVMLAVLMASGGAFALGVGNDNPPSTTDVTNTQTQNNVQKNSNAAASSSTAYGGVSSSTSQATGGNATGGAATAVATGGAGGGGGAGGAGGNSGGNSITGVQVLKVDAVDPHSVKVAKIQADAAIAVADRLSDIKIRNVPSMTGPALVSSNDTCMGSGSGGISGPGFGISIGKTYIDEKCVMQKQARELWNMGFKAAAIARLCMDDNIKHALAVTGYTCPDGRVVTTSTTVVAPAPVVEPAPEPTDPYVRERMGLPPIKE